MCSTTSFSCLKKNYDSRSEILKNLIAFDGYYAQTEDTVTTQRNIFPE